MGNASTFHLYHVDSAYTTDVSPPLSLRPHGAEFLRTPGIPADPTGLVLWVEGTSPLPPPSDATTTTSTSSPPLCTYAVIGFCRIELDSTEAFLSNLTILEAYRGKGHSRRFVEDLKIWASSRGIVYVWPKDPSEESLEWSRVCLLSPAPMALSAWRVLYGGKEATKDFILSPPTEENVSALETVLSLSAPGALARAAKGHQWNVTHFIKAFSLWLASRCGFQEDHALACGLLMAGEVFEGGEVEEEEVEEEGEKEEGEEEEKKVEEDVGALEEAGLGSGGVAVKKSVDVKGDVPQHQDHPRKKAKVGEGGVVEK